MISFSMIEKKGFEVLFQDGKVRLKTRGSSSAGIVLRVREHGLYRLRGKPTDHGRRSRWTRCRFQRNNCRCKI